jgi:hypothetical protein
VQGVAGAPGVEQVLWGSRTAWFGRLACPAVIGGEQAA